MATPGRTRLNALLGSLALTTDLAAGVPPETSLKTCLVAVGIGRALGLPPARLQVAYYAALLRHLGCTAYAHEAARMGGGDDQGVLLAFEAVDPARPAQVIGAALGGLARGRGLGERALAVGRFLGSPRAGKDLAAAHCGLAVQLAGELSLPAGVSEALGQIYERWDGRGEPHGAAGEAICLEARLLHAAMTLEIAHRHAGARAALEAVRRQQGRSLDPEVAGAALEPDAGLAALEAVSVWDAFLAAEPGQPLEALEGGTDDIARAFARYVDLKSPFTLGHSERVARLVEGAADAAGLGADDRRTLRRAALLHDLGRASVPNGIWDKPGPLNLAERERVELHPHYTERILARSPILAALAPLAGGHHERLDGSGYHRGAAGEGVPRLARLLAACDVVAALGEERAHRPAHGPDAAARVLSDEVRRGRLDRWAADHARAAAGHGRAPARDVLPAGLTEREAEVLGHLARGRSNKEIGVAMGISARTVQHHVEHVYAKAEVRTRAAAALFAATHGLA